MKFICFLLFFYSLPAFAQLSGNWQGLIIRDGQAYDKAAIIYFELNSAGDLVGRSREEIPGSDAFVIRKLKGKITGSKVQFRQTVIEKKKDASGVRWCALDAELALIDSTGYLQGRFTSSECRSASGTIICYPSEMKIENVPTVKELQSWRPIFASDLKKGRKAPAIREEERKNFQFRPVYFDHDKAEIKPEYHDFLKAMVKVVGSHSDLRIQVTGHTDADGSETYNVDLSRRRAEAIIAFFVAQGLQRDHIEVDFKGEADPVGNNRTSEGKQLNRRVDFAFI